MRRYELWMAQGQGRGIIAASNNFDNIYLEAFLGTINNEGSFGIMDRVEKKMYNWETGQFDLPLPEQESVYEQEEGIPNPIIEELYKEINH